MRFSVAGGALLLVSMLGWWLLPGSSDAASRLSPISPPTISGTPQVGQTLTESHGTWSLVPLSFNYQWQRCDSAGENCTPISGATNQTYALAQSDLGHTLRVQETAFVWYASARAVSAATAVVSAVVTPVVTPVVTRISTVTALTSLEGGAVADQTVTLIGTVTSTSVTTPPSGTLTFENHGAAISGCQDKPIAPTAQSVTVTCQTSFAASVEQLTATFTPIAGSLLVGSVSAPETLSVSPQATTTSVAVSDPTVHAGKSATYTATVRPSYVGATTPSQTVAFFDNGQPITACATRPLAWTGSVSTATCTVDHIQTGQHLITARYAGDTNFTSSTSSTGVLVDGLVGRIQPMLSWTFYYSPHFTKVFALIVHAIPSGTTVSVSCSGRGCPMHSHAITLHGSARRAGSADLTPVFSGRRLKPGTVIVVSVQRRGWVGKRYVFRIRAAHPPLLGIACQAPGLSPGVGC